MIMTNRSTPLIKIPHLNNSQLVNKYILFKEDRPGKRGQESKNVIFNKYPVPGYFNCLSPVEYRNTIKLWTDAKHLY